MGWHSGIVLPASLLRAWFRVRAALLLSSLLISLESCGGWPKHCCPCHPCRRLRVLVSSLWLKVVDGKSISFLSLSQVCLSNIYIWWHWCCSPTLPFVHLCLSPHSGAGVCCSRVVSSHGFLGSELMDLQQLRLQNLYADL